MRVADSDEKAALLYPDNVFQGSNSEPAAVASFS
jgi:hypothetical protein